MPQERSVYRVAVGDTAETAQLLYLVVADSAVRAEAIVAAHSKQASVWTMGEERNGVFAEEGILAMSEGA
jgi:hypothetical protein